MRGFAVVVCQILVAAAVAVPALAQGHPQVREGFWIGFGMGAGSLGADCNGCSSDRETGLSGNFRLGAAVGPRFLLGAETNGWTKSESGLDQQVGALSVVGFFYPSPASGFYLKGGLGMLRYSADDDFDELSATGLSAQIGVGYDVRVGRNFSLTPYLNILASSGAEVEFNGAGLGVDAKLSLVQFGLGLTWH